MGDPVVLSGLDFQTRLKCYIVDIFLISCLFTGDQGYQAPSFKMVIVRPKMDLNRALRIMGYSSAREFMDTAKDETKEPKKELDKKHFAQSMILMKKKMKGQEVSLKSCIIINYYLVF